MVDSAIAGQVGMVIGGRGGRACDACGVERARWYCAADEAYLCERCDGSVHAANAVARRHERVRVGPSGAPTRRRGAAVESPPPPAHSSSSSAMGTWASRKRPRTRRHHPHRPAPALFPAPDFPVKPEPLSPQSLVHDPDLHVPDLSHLLDCLFDLHDDHALLLHEVPTYTPLSPPCAPDDGHDHRPAAAHRCSAHVDDAAELAADHFFIPGNCIDIDHFLDAADVAHPPLDPHPASSPPVAPDLPDDLHPLYRRHRQTPPFAVYSSKSSCSADDCSAGDAYCSIVEGKPLMHSSPDDAPPAAFYGDDAADVCLHGESPRSWLCKVKVESPPDFSDNDDIVLDQTLDRDYCRPNLGLKLDIEEVLNAWSDQGSLWTDGRRPDESCLDALGGWLVPDLSYSFMHPRDQLGLVPVMDDSNAAKTGAAREARVLRYREKRRNRLFSKKIRYEVRKLNAEKRPRMKGRFVKRAPTVD